MILEVLEISDKMGEVTVIGRSKEPLLSMPTSAHPRTRDKAYLMFDGHKNAA